MKLMRGHVKAVPRFEPKRDATKIPFSLDGAHFEMRL